MKWYYALLKRMLNGIILFLLPLVMLILIIGKAHAIIHSLIQPLKKYLPEEPIMGIGMLSLISIFFLIIICYMAGMIAEKRRVRSMIKRLEDSLLVFLPGYSMLKSRASEAITDSDDKWQAVMVGENDEWKPGIEVDHQPGGYCTVFFPEPPDAKSGEMKLVHESKLKKLDIPVGKLLKIVRKYGIGAAGLMSNEK